MLPNPPARPRTRPSPPPAWSPPPPPASPPRDWAGFRALCAEAGEVADPHRRYEARRALLELALSKGSSPAILLAAAAAAVDMLQADPREPVLLNYAGVIFYELGAVKAAQALFSAAQRLDPELPNVERNLAECARRKRAGVRVLAQAAGPVRDLQPRVDRIAAAARPAEGLTISLCMIVKDEEAMIGRCLQAARDAVDEIVVVDTGSTDRTVEIAESLGARVLHHEWDGDFSAARNVSFEAATGDWVMYLDADEVLVADDVRAPARAGRPHLARGLLPDRDQPHGRSRGRHGDHARRHAPVPQPPRVPLRGAHPRADRPVPAGLPARAPGAHHGARRALRLPGRRSATPRTSPTATWSCSSARWPRASTTPSCTSTSARSTPPPATSSAR